MQYIISATAPPTEPKVASIIDCRELGPYLADCTLQLAESAQYISLDGRRHNDGGYEVDLYNSSDFLLVTLENGDRVVSNITGLRDYMARVGQVFPEELR